MIRKILFASAALLTFSAYSIDDKTITRTTSNGGENGYNSTVYEEDEVSISIECRNPGYEGCPNVPGIVGSGIGVDYALSQIDRDNLKGDDTISAPDGSRYRVMWESDDKSGTTSKIEVLPL